MARKAETQRKSGYISKSFFRSIIIKSSVASVVSFFRRNFIGFVIIFIAVLVFFWPIVTRIDSYSEGGDPMFNAWTLARNHQCILGNNCPDYADGNIYFPNQNSMLYSETQLSAGILTLPLYFINDNPLFAYNVWTIASFMFGGWFMYMLAKYLSKGNELFSVASGLIFTLSPFKMSAVTHLQNLSIFYLPLLVLFILRYIETSQRRYLVGISIIGSLLFNASWYNLAFSFVTVSMLIAGLWISRQLAWKKLTYLCLSLGIALATTIPVMVRYVSFSKAQGASFSLTEQALYASSVVDYFIPHNGTGLGMIAEAVKPGRYINSVSADSFSYHGVSLYFVAVLLLYMAVKQQKKKDPNSFNHRFVWSITAIAAVGFIFSLGPLLKITKSYFYGPVLEESFKVMLVGPYYLLLKILPELSFIRAVGRWSVLVLFALCCLLALFPLYRGYLPFSKQKIKLLSGFLLLFMVFELYPLHRVQMSSLPQAYNIEIPKVYEYVKSEPKIQNLIILNGDTEYFSGKAIFERTSQVLWAGYHNKNLFNGYSGYTPNRYFEDLNDYTDPDKDDILELKKKNIDHILVDKKYAIVGPTISAKVDALTENKIYEDERYVLFSIK